ncbi:multidrug efflux RND transporter permease subunit [Neisseria animalis]|uniref:Efflux pump membrane transporter n=1 Tax=Neisseria animalis TaxID=492 RepID=A0A5P3MQB4_NEIAN|nr:multidrug efflux RND transporter permease subunit [Neisseria animalis]QEY23708.1 multidrug efflux RND transporter permease subunit [Neisseria animalis]ROW32850.1 multidrug efflux RND transporter permease subunit [Neisseria animalis]VEE09530.1 antibiotic resistance efflux pump component [Neisseria animalis]
MALFFIRRPVFAWVLSIFITLAGALSVFKLPLEQYPDIAPPQVSVVARYTGASAETVNDSVAQVIEQRMTGLDGLMYMSSTSDSSGLSRTTITFEPGTDIDVAQVQVQNALQQALSRLPEAVQQRGVTVTRGGQDNLVTWMFYTEDPSVPRVAVTDYLSSNLVDVLGRVDGVAEVQLYGSPYAMRIWLDPHKLEQYRLMPSDVRAALDSQNTQVSAGQLGQLPSVENQMLNVPIRARSKLQTVEQFENIILKSDGSGAAVFLKDVARVELGAESSDVNTRFNGHTGGALGIILADGANALETAAAVEQKIREIEPSFPYGLKAVTSQDSVPFVKASLKEVLKTLAEAVVLVVLVMYLFLQSWRATLIPAIAVPVVLMGTLGILAVSGYSINMLTMFALVLAIGLLVDDAIVVVENVERVMHDEGLDAPAATEKSMREISSALVGVGLVLSAVFVPMAFFPGTTGVIYRQFAVTLIAAMGFSVIVALTLSPALCAQFLKPKARNKPAKGLFRGLFAAFNHRFDALSARYGTLSHKLFERGRLMAAAFLAVIAACAVLFYTLPTSFLPEEDQGFLQVNVTLPPGATDARLRETLAPLEQYFHDQPEVATVMTLTGIRGNQGFGLLTVRLKPWEGRSPEQSAAALESRAAQAFRQYKNAKIFVNMPPVVRGLGSAGGLSFVLKDTDGKGYDELNATKDRLIGLAEQSKLIRSVRANNQEPRSQLVVEVDDRAAVAHQVALGDVNTLLSHALGGAYVNDFIHNGRVKRVYIQADAPFRMQPQDIGQWKVRNAQGEMIPLSSFSALRWEVAPPQLIRFSGSLAMNMQAAAADGISSGEAMAELQRLVEALPHGYQIEWTGASLQEQRAGALAPLLYVLSVLFVFLCLAALYESWSVPLAVMLSAVSGVLGALLFTGLRGLENDVFFQVGLLATIGLAAKNAILIVEFAVQLQARGHSLRQAAAEAARLRLRPIVMTSLAFGFGVIPLALGTGAGAASRVAIGTAVLGGTVVSTILGLLFVPLFFVWIRAWFARKKAV